ncbi:hypothetical protein AB0F15_08890 [Amycolatopsis sp. NPDC026612]|uniref:hypothetical protein n=1 Tax=Amycolatopsis sp. NPDC026612 TaxID=3155466 RepID=UPI0033D9966D
MTNRPDNAYTALVRHVVDDSARTFRTALLVLVVALAVVGIVVSVALTSGGLGTAAVAATALIGGAARALRRR